jgi:hypothetical protein
MSDDNDLHARDIEPPDPLDIPAARCGTGEIDGACWRPGDPVKHLGPPKRLAIPLYSALFQTRCGLGPRTGAWRPQAWGENDDYWCPACLDQAGIVYELWTDDTDYRDPVRPDHNVLAGRRTGERARRARRRVAR